MVFCKGMRNELLGTYICESVNPTDSLYLVIKEDKTYQLYKQFHTISSGKYISQQDAVYALREEDTEDCYLVYDGQDTVYYYTSTAGVQVYKKISKLPVYINPE